MADPVQEKIDEHIQWLEHQIADCEKKSFETMHAGKEYLKTLKASLSQFSELKRTTSRRAQ